MSKRQTNGDYRGGSVLHTPGIGGTPKDDAEFVENLADSLTPKQRELDAQSKWRRQEMIKRDLEKRRKQRNANRT